MTTRPSNLYLLDDIDFERNCPISDGGFGELFVGFHKVDGKVALKRLRIRGTGEERQGYLVDTMAEARVWRALSHPNVLPFLGILFEGRDVYLVSPFMENGSLPHYIDTHPEVDRLNLLIGVAEGISYLHGQGLVHGDIKGCNIVINLGPRAALCDFGLSKILTSSFSSSAGGVGTTRWQSPELMNGGARSFECDVYAYGMTIYEVRERDPRHPSPPLTSYYRKIISRRIPFYDLLEETAVIVAVLLRDERPPLEGSPFDLYVTLRDAAQRCWVRLPERRPSMKDIVQLLASRASPDSEQFLEVVAITVAENVQPGSSTPDTDGCDHGSDPLPDRPKLADKFTPSWNEVATLRGHTGFVRSVTFSPDGSRLASGSEDSTVCIWDVVSGKIMLTLRGHTNWVWRVEFSPDGSRLASASDDSTVRLWNAETGEELAVLRGHIKKVWCVTFSPDGLRLASGSHDQTVRLWDVKSGVELATLEHTDKIWNIAFSPDGSRLASGSIDRTVRLWALASRSVVARLRGHTDSISSIAFSPDGSRLASGSYDWTVRLWDTESGTEMATLRDHKGRVHNVAFSPDGSRLASGSDDANVWVWDVASATKLMKLQGHNTFVWSVAFSPDGLRLASGSGDSTVRVWDTASGAEMAVLRGHTHPIRRVVFSPDGSLLASGSRDATVRLWHV